jgi:hypothetical protein
LRESRPDVLLEVEPAHLARMGSTAADVGKLLRQDGYSTYRLTESPTGELTLRPIEGLDSPAPSPNVFATIDPIRARSGGIHVV